uniref:Uncharacterized protein n=1 Tax=Chrysocystis fragilis TaxID=1411660 RepID=A0A7S0TB80_9STRA
MKPGGGRRRRKMVRALSFVSNLAVAQSIVVTTSMLRSTEVTLGKFVISRPMPAFQEPEAVPVAPSSEPFALWAPEDVAIAAMGTLAGVAAHFPVPASLAVGAGLTWAAHNEREYGLGLLARGVGKAGLYTYALTERVVEEMMASDIGQASKKALDELIETGGEALMSEASKHLRSATDQFEVAKGKVQAQLETMRSFPLPLLNVEMPKMDAPLQFAE